VNVSVRPLRVGVVGFGSIGRHHARNLFAMDDVELVGVVDPSPLARSHAEQLGYATFTTSRALLDAGIEAAIISPSRRRLRRVHRSLVCVARGEADRA
jgi:UDP-N-acetylglucosamine 3-dehydrogenase